LPLIPPLTSVPSAFLILPPACLHILLFFHPLLFLLNVSSFFFFLSCSFLVISPSFYLYVVLIFSFLFCFFFPYLLSSLFLCSYFSSHSSFPRCMRCLNWLRCYATSWKVAGSVANKVIGFFD
jgi:hypothetical protein